MTARQSALHRLADAREAPEAFGAALDSGAPGSVLAPLAEAYEAAERLALEARTRSVAEEAVAP